MYTERKIASTIVILPGFRPEKQVVRKNISLLHKNEGIVNNFWQFLFAP